MSNEGANIEKLLERYVTGDLSESDRELVEQFLTGSGADAVRARQDLRFEKLLAGALDIPVKDDRIADAVLDRVYRRPLPESRRDFRPDLALQVLKDAEKTGRIGDQPQAFWNWRVRRLATAASLLFVFFGAMWFNSKMNERNGTGAGQGVQNAVVFDTVAEVAYIDSVPPGPLTRGPRIPAIPRVDQPGQSILAGDEVKTDEGETALVRFSDGGRIFLQPMSRVQIIRHGHGRISLRVLEGAMVFDFSKTNGAVTVESSEGHYGRLKGVGVLTLASRSDGTPRPSMASSLGQILLVRVKQNGYAAFRSAAGMVRINSGQLGVVSPEVVVCVDDNASRLKNVLNPKDWALKDIIRNPEQPAVQVAQRLLKRQDIVQEALRVYEFELIDMIAASFVIETEMKRLGCSPTPGEIADANRFVKNDELMQVLPLRSADARRERGRQIAGLLAINRFQREKRGLEPGTEALIQVKQRIWAQLHQHLIVDRKVDDATMAFRIRFRGKVREVKKSETWGRLRQFLRRSELVLLVKGLAEKTILDIWLEQHRRDWPTPPDAAEFPHVAVAQMAGLTRVQMQDLLQIESLILQNSRNPSTAEVERFMKEKVSKRRELLFDHYFFPVTDPFRGTLLAPKRRQAALRQAQALVAKLRKKEAITEKDTTVPAPRFSGSLWTNGPTGGPRPWWNQLYGRSFMLKVMNLAEGEVSDPIQSPEGFHVVVLRHEGEDKSDPRSHKSYAQLIYRFELARQDFEHKVKSKTTLLCSLDDLLK